MKERHKAARGLNARETLRALNLNASQDFHALSPFQVGRLLEEADRVKYRKPKNANGSRGRYFFQKLVREARRNG